MKFLSMSYLVVLMQAVSAYLPDFPGDTADANAWAGEGIQQIHVISTKSPEEAIPELGQILAQVGRPLMLPRGEYEQEVLAEAQQAMVAIPGHAEFYAARLNAARERLDAARQIDPNEGGLPLHDLVREQSNDFEILALMPSPETVHVLGEFLSDERGAYLPEKGQHPMMDAGEHANRESAAIALSKLPIADRPITIPWRRITSSKIESVTHTWELWYAQVKAGNRTFRFEGDDKEYSLNGPVTASNRPSARSSFTSTASTPSSPDTIKPMAPFWPAVLVGAVILILAGGWLLVRQRNRSLSRQ